MTAEEKILVRLQEKEKEIGGVVKLARALNTSAPNWVRARDRNVRLSAAIAAAAGRLCPELTSDVAVFLLTELPTRKRRGRVGNTGGS
jgi:hypothetical protein